MSKAFLIFCSSMQIWSICRGPWLVKAAEYSYPGRPVDHHRPQICTQRGAGCLHPAASGSGCAADLQCTGWQEDMEPINVVLADLACFNDLKIDWKSCSLWATAFKTQETSNVDFFKPAYGDNGASIAACLEVRGNGEYCSELHMHLWDSKPCHCAS